MNKELQKWSDALKSAFPNAFSPYWRDVPVRRMTKLLTACFLIAAAMGFVADLLQIKAPPLAHGFFWPVFIRVIGVGIFSDQENAFGHSSHSVVGLGWIPRLSQTARIGTHCNS